MTLRIDTPDAGSIRPRSFEPHASEAGARRIRLACGIALLVAALVAGVFLATAWSSSDGAPDGLLEGPDTSTVEAPAQEAADHFHALGADRSAYGTGVTGRRHRDAKLDPTVFAPPP